MAYYFTNQLMKLSYLEFCTSIEYISFEILNYIELYKFELNINAILLLHDKASSVGLYYMNDVEKFLIAEVNVKDKYFANDAYTALKLFSLIAYVKSEDTVLVNLNITREK